MVEQTGLQRSCAGHCSVVEQLLAKLPPVTPDAGGEHGAAGEGGAAAGNPPPILTFTGDKLRPEWTAKFLAGQIPYRPRPWLYLRMPSFPTGAEVVAQGLAMSHGLPPVTQQIRRHLAPAPKTVASCSVPTAASTATNAMASAPRPRWQYSKLLASTSATPANAYRRISTIAG